MTTRQEKTLEALKTLGQLLHGERLESGELRISMASHFGPARIYTIKKSGAVEYLPGAPTKLQQR